MTNAGAAFLTGLLGGGLKGYELRRAWDKQDADQKLSLEDHDRKVAQDKEMRDALNVALGGEDPGSPGTNGAASAPQTPALTPAPVPGLSFANPGEAIARGAASFTQTADGGAAAPGDAPGDAPALQAPAASRLSGNGGLSPFDAITASAWRQPGDASAPAASAGAVPAASPAMNLATNPATLGDGSGAAGGGVSAVVANAASRGDQQAARLNAFARAAAAKGDIAMSSQFAQAADAQKRNQGYFTNALEVAQDPAGEKARALAGMIGSSGLPGTTIVTDPKTGISTLQIQNADGGSKSYTLSGSTLMRLSIAQQKLADGDPSALTELAAVDKDLASHGLAAHQFNQHLVSLNNQAANAVSNINYRDQRAVREDARQDLAEKKLDMQADRAAQVNASIADAAQAAGQSPEAVAAYRVGAKPSEMQHLMPKAAGADKYQVQVDAVRKALSSPQMDAAGKPVMNLMTGVPNMVPDMTREQRFYDFMNAAGIKNTNEGLLKFKQAEKQISTIPAGAVALLTQNPKLAYEFDRQFGPGMSSMVLGRPAAQDLVAPTAPQVEQPLVIDPDFNPNAAFAQ